MTTDPLSLEEGWNRRVAARLGKCECAICRFPSDVRDWTDLKIIALRESSTSGRNGVGLATLADFLRENGHAVTRNTMATHNTKCLGAGCSYYER